MKVVALTRSSTAYAGRSGDVRRVSRNPNPSLHPFQREREYTRALQATKLDRILAKPFLHAFDQHHDAVGVLATSPVSLSALYSGACDGELKAWHLGDRTNTWSVGAHDGFVRGLAVTCDGRRLVSCGQDRTVKIWDTQAASTSSPAGRADIVPLQTLLGPSPFTSTDAHAKDAATFVTAGAQVNVWRADRTDPVQSFKWGADTVTCARFSRVEVDVLASCSSDRAVTLYDTRAQTPIQKLTMAMASNALCWNPMEAFVFTIANDDANLYTFDMRRLDIARNVLSDHVAAVMSVDYSPTGRELVSGGYDRTVRIWAGGQGHSRDVYTAKRMQRVHAVRYSADNRFVLSASDDTNIRLWKAQAAKTLQAVLPREERFMAYTDKLKERFGQVYEIKRIAKHRHLPSGIHSRMRKERIVKRAEQRKEQNRRKHSAPGTVPHVPERAKHIVAVEQ